MKELDPPPRFDEVYYNALKHMNDREKWDLTESNSDICKCGHNIHEHEAVYDCKCYVYGCSCGGFDG